MKLLKARSILGFVSLFLSLGVTTAYAYDCDSDCGAEARFTYSCPTFSNPGRKCEGRNPAKFAACSADKEVSCGLWTSIENAVNGRVRSALEPNFNSRTWAAVAGNGPEEEGYMSGCIAAGVAVCGALGTEFGGPWGGVLSGAGGAFISYRLCQQSKSW